MLLEGASLAVVHMRQSCSFCFKKLYFLANIHFSKVNYEGFEHHEFLALAELCLRTGAAFDWLYLIFSNQHT